MTAVERLARALCRESYEARPPDSRPPPIAVDEDWENWKQPALALLANLQFDHNISKFDAMLREIEQADAQIEQLRRERDAAQAAIRAWELASELEMKPGKEHGDDYQV